MKIYIITLLLILINGCNNRNYDYVSMKTILSQNEVSNSGFLKYKIGNFLYLSDHFKGDRGNLFQFYPNAYLASYSFKIDSTNASYIETFDSVSHKIINLEGNPIVYKDINADKHPDSINVQYLITTFSYDNIKFAISDSGRQYKDMQLTDTLLDDYRNIKYVSSVNFIKSTKNCKRFYQIGRFTGKLKNTNILKIYYDTIDLSKRLVHYFSLYPSASR